MLWMEACRSLMKSRNNWELALSVHESQLAANIGVWAETANTWMPGYFTAEIGARRSLGAGGTLAFVMTNGQETLAVFEDGYNLNEETPSKTIWLGGRMFVPNPAMNPILVFQNAGPGIFSSIKVDNLRLWQTTPR